MFHTASTSANHDEWRPRTSGSQTLIVELISNHDEEDNERDGMIEEEGTSMFITDGTEMGDCESADERVIEAEEGRGGPGNNNILSQDDDEIELEESPATPAATKALSERHRLEFMVIVFGGMALAFNAGFVNGCTYLIGDIPVSHITGTTTKTGLFLGQSDFESFAKNLALVVSFIFGASITGAMMPKDSFQLGREYGPLFVIGSLFFLLSYLTTFFAPDTKLFYYFAAMACGLQNGITTKYSGSIIRTTHMTGAGTDIGLVLGRIVMGDYKESWKLLVLIPLLTSYLIGGTFSVYVHRRLGVLSLLVNVVAFMSIGIAYSIIIGRELHIPFWRALFGFYVTVEKKVLRLRVNRKVKS